MVTGLNQITKLMEKEKEKGTFPGAVLAIVSDQDVVYHQEFGLAQLKPIKREMRKNTVFGLASLTKVVATTTAVMHLIEKGEINLWDYLSEYFPQLPEEKNKMTIYHLLTHTSGYQAIVKLWDIDLDYEEKIKYILDLPLEAKMGSRVKYSDPNFILLGELIKRVTGVTMDHYLDKNIFQPLEMESTLFNPLQNSNLGKSDFAATEYCDWRERMIIGEVHDENAYSLGGVSGHAGLFSTSSDLINFVKMLLNNGLFKGKRVLAKPTIKTMTSCWTRKLAENRGLGWDLVDNYRSSGGILFSSSSFGHTGFTGTSLWVDPEMEIGVIFLTNRVHPSRENVQIISLRPRLHNLIARVLSNSGIV